MTLDVVVPTYNRSGLLRLTIASLFAGERPDDLEITILIIDNNSKDDTEQVVRGLQANAPLPLRYIRETKQGLSNARNAGIAAGHSELVGFIDDDEEIEPHWYQVISREFSDPSVDFIGGPYLANWVTKAPSWLPPGYHAAIGHVPPKPRSSFGPDFGGNLMGGNAVMRRTVFDRVGTYSTRLGRSGKGLLSEEDAEFCRRLESASIRGMYVPDLAIRHYIAPERLTRRYHRRWVYWRAVSQGVLDRELQEPVPYLFGIPRYKVARSLRCTLAYPVHLLLNRNPGIAFADELAVWDLFGFIYGKHFIHIEGFYADKAIKPQT